MLDLTRLFTVKYCSPILQQNTSYFTYIYPGNYTKGTTVYSRNPHYPQHEKLARLASFHDHCCGMITWRYTSHPPLGFFFFFFCICVVRKSTSLSDTSNLNLTRGNYSSFQLKSTSPNFSLSAEGRTDVAYRSVETLSVILDDKSHFVKF